MGTVEVNQQMETVEVTMKTLLAIGLLILAAHGAPLELELDNEWENFKQNFERQFASKYEHDTRKAVFADNLRLINKHNAEHAIGLHSYTLGINDFADLTNEEFVKMYNGFVAPSNIEQVEFNGVVGSLPESVDWRSKGYVTPVKNQGQCGSCWAFSAVVTMEGAHYKKAGKLVSLSEQNLVDCVGKDHGCNGGLPFDAIRYVIHNHGIDTEESYKYTASEGQCHFNKSNVGATIRHVVRLPSANETALQEAVATIGPVSVGIDASHRSFQLYKHGLYHEHHCSDTLLDHGVAVVGFGTENGQDYYLVKNSWGASWGEDGYIKMRRNQHNQCGIATMAVYAVA